MWSRLTVSVFIDRKKPSEVLDKIMMHWIGAAFGVMEAILTDNGGEFNSEETREVASVLNIELCTSAAQSPFQNGLCERIHSVTDSMLLKLQEQCPRTPLDVLICWANMARNALQMWHGYSSFQIVFGINPNLPNILTDKPPALEGRTTSEVLVKHLNALHAARKSFVESESDERIRRALRSKVRASEQRFVNGDRVYYKREGHDKWLGPGKVVFQDGKVVFVRHGSVFVRVSPNRLVKTGQEIVMNLEDPNPQTPQLSLNGAEFEDHITDDVVQPICETIGEKVKVTRSDREEINGLSKSRKNYLKPCEKIEFRPNPDNDWIKGTIVNRARKATGRNRNWFNVDIEGSTSSVDLGSIEWHKVQPVHDPEEVNVVLIPRARHGEIACMTAKQIELQKLQLFKTYDEVEDIGQYRISTTWVLWKKGEEMRARLVARGFEEDCGVPTDSPTISKSILRIMLSV